VEVQLDSDPAAENNFAGSILQISVVPLGSRVVRRLVDRVKGRIE